MEKWSRDLPNRTHLASILALFRIVREENATRTTREGLEMFSCVEEESATRTISVGLVMCRGARVLSVTKTISAVFSADEAKEY